MLRCHPKCSLKHFLSFFNSEEKPSDREQGEELESELTDVASQAEGNPPGIPTENKEPRQNQDSSKEDVSTETQQTISQPCTTRTSSGRGRTPKTSLSTAAKKTNLKKEKENAAHDVSEFQDDPSDADYTPSMCLYKKQIYLACVVKNPSITQKLYDSLPCL